MIVYSATKQKFAQDVSDFYIEEVIEKQFQERLLRKVSEAEKRSWKESLTQMNNVLADPGIPGDAGVLVEFRIPQSAFRVDFIITGQDVQNKENVIIVELKQWAEADVTDKDGIVKTSFNGRSVETQHPSYQAWSYSAFLQNFNETIYTEKITLNPCAYLHNYRNDGKINSSVYSPYIDRAPLFLREDKLKLRDFIKRFIHKGDHKNVMYRIEHGKIKPSKALADSLAGMLKGNEEFILLDDQKLVFETAISGARKAEAGGKTVLIVEGGPGTGKSVVAINLLVALTKRGLVTKYVTKNSAPREVYKTLLTGEIKGSRYDFLFNGSGAFTETPMDTFGALIVDEAHRLNAKSGMFSHLGENQIKEIIHSAKFSAFFIDENQKIAVNDIGTIDEIEKWAAHFGAKVRKMELKSQFRCNGSNGYLAWLDDVLQIHETANTVLEKTEFNFEVVSSPAEMRDRIYALNETSNKARMLAGYCWDWKSKQDKSAFDIVFPEFGFSNKWNLESDGMNWIISKESVREVGCIHTSQGLELEHVGVIVGLDLIVRNGKVKTDFRKRSSKDKTIWGLKEMAKKDSPAAAKLADQIIKNTYRTLFTRGMKSCMAYFVDQETAEYFQARTKS